MDTRPRNKTKKLQARSELKISAKMSFAAPAAGVAVKRKKPPKRETPKPLRQLYPQAKSSPGLISLQAKPPKKPEAKLKSKAKKPKSPEVKPEAQPSTEMSKFAPNIKNESKITRQSYEAWVNTTPAAVMRQIQRIKAENALQNRVGPEKRRSPLRLHNDALDERFGGKLKIVNRRTITHLTN